MGDIVSSSPMQIPGCPTCTFPLERQHRSIVGRLVFRRLWVCRACGRFFPEYRKPFERTCAYLLSRHTRCLSCGSARVRRLTTRDRIDRMSRHPFSLLSAITGGSIYHCNVCRFQYHDWRSPDPAAQQDRRPKAATLEDDSYSDAFSPEVLDAVTSAQPSQLEDPTGHIDAALGDAPTAGAQ